MVLTTTIGNNTRRMNNLIVDLPLPCSKQSASSKSKLKVRFSELCRLNVIARATPEENRLMYISSKEMANIKYRFAITVRKTWQMLNDTEVRTTLLSPHIILSCLNTLTYWLISSHSRSYPIRSESYTTS